ncbi:transcriptional regulator [Komagataeibacter nataicola]|uniref:Transcriptional regulator n=2 Tax=Komagataeibacter TaxID=1434011 RepID=A0A9N7CXK6_9PROT|nr:MULTISPECIES: MucR family transcriptional regulator [Komagataeibacter]AQU87046.1 transcriptional regulator [Komagataeibacter nataicola]MBV0889209.1 MucR family transcriptional regulator [Komagataeibacter oboediens]MBV1830208.1 MucR family transcriptional regulator [Komagataeibacter melomenusus]MCK9821220.1 MucR family transcriptional regulator [Komagataeibacter oboediens]NPC65702.1 MucR family transcriptional regulator [Komagataeibacter melomenusus]
MTDHEALFSESTTLRNITVRIVTAYASRNKISADILPELISSVFQTISQLGRKVSETPNLVPAVPVKKSVFPDYIVCLEDGKKLKMLKRHLRSAYDMTPQQYREKWGLSENYPMVAPTYAVRRSALAQEIGLRRAIKAPAEISEASEIDIPVTRLPEKKQGRRPKLT